MSNNPIFLIKIQNKLSVSSWWHDENLSIPEIRLCIPLNPCTAPLEFNPTNLETINYTKGRSETVSLFSNKDKVSSYM